MLIDSGAVEANYISPVAWGKLTAADPDIAKDMRIPYRGQFRPVCSPLGITAEIAGYVDLEVNSKSIFNNKNFDSVKIRFLLLDIGVIDLMVGFPTIKKHQMALWYRDVFGICSDTLREHMAHEDLVRKITLEARSWSDTQQE
jgi:hypothetical protein